MVIDACFDSIVISGEAPALSIGNKLSAREVAWAYYHTMLNTRVVNATITFCCSYLLLAALALGLRSKPRHHARWRMLVPMAFVGVGAYACVIVPRYYNLRSATAFDQTFFDGWWTVVAARLVSLAAIFVGMPICFPILCDLATQPR